MAVFHQAGAVRFYNFDNELCLTRSETLSHTSISTSEGVDLTIDACSIDGFGVFKIIFNSLVLALADQWWLHFFTSSELVCNAVLMLSCELLNKGSAVSLSVWWLWPLLNSVSLMTGGCWLPNIQSRLACQGIVSPLSLHLLTFLSSWQEPTVAVSVWQVHLRSSIPRARASSYGPTLCQVTEELKLIVLLWTECSEPLALERVFSSSLG